MKNPDAPATQRQMEYLRILCKETETDIEELLDDYDYQVTKQLASNLIGDLKDLKERQRAVVEKATDDYFAGRTATMKIIDDPFPDAARTSVRPLPFIDPGAWKVIDGHHVIDMSSGKPTMAPWLDWMADSTTNTKIKGNTPMSEFNPITIYLNREEMDDAYEGKLAKTVMADRIKEALPLKVDLEVGMTYLYGSGHKYEVVRVGEAQVVIRRTSSNSAGPAENIVERRVKVESDIRDGNARIITEED